MTNQTFAPQGYAPQGPPSWAGPGQPQQAPAGAPQPVKAQSQDAEEATFGGGEMSAPFLKIGPATSKRPAYTQPGEPRGGTIVRIQEVHAHKRGAYDQATKKYGREPMYYKNGPKTGQPIMQWKLTLQTDLRDPEIEGDTGLRALELEGMDAHWQPVVPFNCKKRAARLAVEAAGAKGLQLGGQFYIAYTRTVPTQGLEIDPIDWAAQYIPPGQFASFETAPVEQQAPQQAPAQQPQQAV